jgi:hypothetical protein
MRLYEISRLFLNVFVTSHLLPNIKREHHWEKRSLKGQMVFNKTWTDFCRKHDSLFMSLYEISRLFLNEFECVRYFL